MSAVDTEGFEVLKGDLLGEGCFRQVYQNKLNPKQVIKVEDNNGNQRQLFCNIIEWVTWNAYKDCPKIAKWLAPCVSISGNGRVLVQRKVDPIPDNYKLPKKLPAFLTDLKTENFGLIDNQLVCVDYGFLPSNISTKKIPVKW